MADLEESGRLKERGLDRILALSDGVFAFSITLMVLDLVVPALGSSPDANALWGLLAGEWLGFLNYFLSFFIVSIWWNAHHRYFEYIEGYDEVLKALNLLTLLAITLEPFFTKLNNVWIGAPVASALYALDQATAGTFLALTWWYASKNRRFVVRNMDEKIVRRIRVGSLVTPIVFSVSIPVAFAYPSLVGIVWFSTGPLVYILRRKYRV